MDAAKSPAYLRSLAEAVVEFRAAFSHFMTFHVFNDFMARGIAPAVFPRDDADPEAIATAQETVDIAAGKASAATRLTGAYMMVSGLGKVDPIAGWHSITQPKPVLEPDNILTATGMMIGSLEDLAKQAEANATPSVTADKMHPLVWGAARSLWKIGKYRQAVAGAGEALAGQLKILTGRNDVAETNLWSETFAVEPPTRNAPRLRWPGDPKDRTVKSMRGGLKNIAPGIQQTIRNTATHGSEELEEHDALERLAALSLLARWVEKCELVEYPEDEVSD